MLLNKNAFLRASVAELIALEGLQDRVEKFMKVNDEYLAHMEDQKQLESLQKQRHLYYESQ